MDIKDTSLPSVEEVKTELKNERNKIRYRRILKNAVYALIIVAAIAALIATLVLPVLQISGTSMEPTLNNGEIVVLVKTSKPERGDLCGFSYSNKILIKRVIGLPGDTISIDKEGNVFVNGEVIDEPYVVEKSLGECDLEFPYTVPDNAYFMLGDQRKSSIDSRSSVIGSIESDQLIGKLVFRIWPFSKFSLLS